MEIMQNKINNGQGKQNSGVELRSAMFRIRQKCSTVTIIRQDLRRLAMARVNWVLLEDWTLSDNKTRFNEIQRSAVFTAR